MKRMATWFVLLNKRLYKKATFLCILLTIPVLVAVFQIASREPSGVVTVILACEAPQDALCQEIMENLKADTKIISFLEDTPENARLLVSAGKADAAWIFPENMGERIRAFVSGDTRGFVQVLEREQTVVLGLARERLNGELFLEAVKESYLRYVRTYAPEASDRSDAELLSYLDNANVTGTLFEYYDIYGNQKTETANYLTSPIRGLLAVVVAIGSAVTALYYQKDQENGIFSLLPQRYRIWGELGYQMVSALNLMTAVLLALAVSGLSVNLFLELLLAVLYTVCCSVFGMLLRAVFGGGRWLATWIPVLSLLMLVLCPVFFDHGAMQKIQLLFPPTYFITGAYHYSYLLYGTVYTVALALITTILTAVKKRLHSTNKVRRVACPGCGTRPVRR